MISRTLARVVEATCVLLAFVNLSGVADAQQPPGNLTFAWDPSSDPSVVGYRLYEGGQSSLYTNVSDIGSSTSAVISGLVPGATYYFAVTAYDAYGLESTFSGEISYTVPSGLNLPTLGRLLIPVGGAAATLSGTGKVGDIYNVLVSSNFLSWQTIGTVIVGADGLFQFSDPSAGPASARFYRLQSILSQGGLPALQNSLSGL